MLTFVFERSAHLFVGALSLSFELVVAVVDGPFVAYRWLYCVQSLDDLLVLPYNLVASNKAEFVALQLASSYYVGELPCT